MLLKVNDARGLILVGCEIVEMKGCVVLSGEKNNIRSDHTCLEGKNNELIPDKEGDPDCACDKPPLGIAPKMIWQRDRHFELVMAIRRYEGDGREIPEKWKRELAELTCELWPVEAEED